MLGVQAVLLGDLIRAAVPGVIGFQSSRLMSSLSKHRNYNAVKGKEFM